jgi:hypothetical protein
MGSVSSGASNPQSVQGAPGTVDPRETIMAERKSILLRLRPEIYAALQRWAADEFRSVNGQIEFLLDRALRDAGRRPKGGGAAAADPEEEGREESP